MRKTRTKKKIKKENEKHPDILFFTVSVSLSASAVSRKRIPNQKADVMFEKRKSKKQKVKSKKKKRVVKG
jgi:hypothetical protein